jgi:predicted DNA-binding transcriptional regulator AlpA
MIVGKLYRFKDLAQLGVRNYPTLNRWIETQGFPKGRLLGENTRVWTEAELLAWFDSRPTDPPPNKAKPGPKGATSGTGRTAENSNKPHLDSEPDASVQASSNEEAA